MTAFSIACNILLGDCEDGLTPIWFTMHVPVSRSSGGCYHLGVCNDIPQDTEGHLEDGQHFCDHTSRGLLINLGLILVLVTVTQLMNESI